MTLMSGKVYSDAGTPSNAVGDQGDIFMQLDGLKITYRKEGGAWTPIGNQLGTIPEFLKGVGVPSNVLGQDNQYYREVNTDTIYEKQSGVWTNIASWTSLEIQQLLLSNGIGADLAATNHVSNIDTFIEAGAEGYFDNTTTGTKPATYGLVKVWRESPTIIYQKAQVAVNGKWATRYTSAGGDFTGIAWRVTANEDGDNTRRFKALAGVAADDVAVMGQLPSLPSFGSLTAQSVTIPTSTGNMILKWGYNSDNTVDVDKTIAFPVAFPTACLNVIAVGDAASNPAAGQVINVGSLTAAGFLWSGAAVSGFGVAPEASSGWWVAIGY